MKQQYKNKVILLSRKVAQVFSLFNFTWRNSQTPPSSEEIYESFCRLYGDLMLMPNSEFISSGRLTVSRIKDENNSIEIKFSFDLEETFYE